MLAARKITLPTPIQAATLPDSLAGRDVLGRGRTGSGKTYAFLLPLVARLQENPRRAASKRPRALILAPTRELAAQIDEALRPLAETAGLSSITVFGGVGENPQIRGLSRGVDVVVACPGRLLALIRDGHVSLDSVEITVIDEADQMADMGFLPMVTRLLTMTPARGQRMLFSATLDAGVNVLVQKFLHNPVTHQADSPEVTVDTMEHHVLQVRTDDRTDVLADLAAAPGRAILFTRTKHGAKKLTKQLIARGIPAVELHGNLGQNARTRNLAAFEAGRVETMVATDIAARGIDVDDVELVVHADPPSEEKAYLHRSGRTARAGKSGTVITIVTPDQQQDVKTIMRRAHIRPEVDQVRVGDQLLLDLAPGARVQLSAEEAQRIANPNAGQAVAARQPNRSGGRGASRPSGRATARTAAASPTSTRTSAPRTGAAAFSASLGRRGR